MFIRYLLLRMGICGQARSSLAQSVDTLWVFPETSLKTPLTGIHVLGRSSDTNPTSPPAAEFHLSAAAGTDGLQTRKYSCKSACRDSEFTLSLLRENVC
jgi:hypothetical protein